MNTKKSKLLISILALALIWSCAVGGGDDPDPPVNPPVDPPVDTVIPVVTSISALKSGNAIDITWSYDKPFTTFELYREADSGSAVLIKSGLTTKTFKDDEYPYDTGFFYKIVVLHNGKRSENSTKSNKLNISTSDIKVQNIKASVLTYANEIRLTWNPVRGAESYKIYRYNFKSDANSAADFSSANTSFTDSNPGNDKAHYYKVSWVKGGTEYGQSGSWAFGITTSVADVYEPNNSIDDIPENAGSVIFDPNQQYSIYSREDGLDGRYRDEDYYIYRGSLGDFEFKISFIEVPPNNTLKLQYIYNDIVCDPIDLNSQINNCSKNLDSQDFVYFRIYTTGTENFTAKYTITKN